ncbi:MAG: VOC family protein [Pyrinomonadaceae bacterium]
MKLGTFSVSLTVKDINASKEFYEKLGFTAMGGDIEQNWLIMKNANSVIGLFQGMFESNILTFNPGWDQNAEALEDFDDIREIQLQLKANGVQPETEVEANTTGPASIILNDPDGNTILIDQHV